jgi:hypothetical protein
LQDLAASRRTCNELVLAKEKLEREMAELEAVTAFGRLESLQQQKDARSVQMLQELHSMYTTLEDASRFVNKDKKNEEES